MKDLVKHPSHYTLHPAGIECIKIVQEFPYNVGVAMSYCWRHEHKGQAIQDLEKAVQHLQFEIERLRGLDAARNKPTVHAKGVCKHLNWGALGWSHCPDCTAEKRDAERSKPFSAACEAPVNGLRKHYLSELKPAHESGFTSLCTNKGCHIDGFCKC